MEGIVSFFQNNSGIFNIIFSLIIVFQWIDRRSKGKWLENSLIALKEMSERLKELSEKAAIKQKSADLISIINALINTLNSPKNLSLFWRKTKKENGNEKSK